MKVYVFREQKTAMFFHQLGAFTNYNTAKMKLCSFLEYSGQWDKLGDFHIEEYDLPFVGRHVYYLNYYKGYDYNYENGSVYNVSANQGLFACKNHCKQSDLWKECMSRISLNNIGDYLILDDGIGFADDCFKGNLFTYGDVMENKWSLTIEKMRVNKVNLLETVGTVEGINIVKGAYE